MFLRLSIVSSSGIEIYTLESEGFHINTEDPQLISGFMFALQSFSESLDNPLQEIKFADMVLYIRTYGEFIIQLLFRTEKNRIFLERLFNSLSGAIFPLLESTEEGFYPPRDKFHKAIYPIVKPLLSNHLNESLIEMFSATKHFLKIAIVGLSKAGKTTLKKMFFERWTKNMLNQIKPTVGIEYLRRFNEFLSTGLIVLDFGGQEVYRDAHLKKIDHWKGTSLILFIVDLQEPDSFTVASEYLHNIWNLLKMTNNQMPKLSIILHKYDLDKRPQLKRNIDKAMIVFKDFINIATFYLSTIDDDSGVLALLKSMFFAVPNIILKKLLTDNFLDFLESEVIPQYFTIVEHPNFEEIFEKLKTKIHERTIEQGLKLNRLIQIEWLKYLSGEWFPKSKSLSTKLINLTQKGQTIFLDVPNYSEREIPNYLINELIHGLLEGLLKPFNISPPRLVKEKTNSTVWEIKLDSTDIQTEKNVNGSK
ncbi:MAG: Rab family GTPase [Candidatus Hodarchaeales archaeon]